MKIRLLIATSDNDYTEHISGVLSAKYADTFYVSVCRAGQSLSEMIAAQGFDAALLEAQPAEGIDLSSIRLLVFLWEENCSLSGIAGNPVLIRKHQRISSIVSSILENYSKVSSASNGPDSSRASVTAVWSPAGGVGKTTVGLAYASKLIAEGKQVLYLNLEHFSSSPMYFADTGKSISSVFEMLEKGEGNVKMLIRGIVKQDQRSGISYFCRPENFDDINILSPADITTLIAACASVADELVVDLSSTCDERTRQVFSLADRIFLVTDHTAASYVKLRQFTSQNSVFQRIRNKTAIVANKDASLNEPPVDSLIRLPFVQAGDVIVVYKTLSSCIFEAQPIGRR